MDRRTSAYLFILGKKKNQTIMTRIPKILHHIWVSSNPIPAEFDNYMAGAVAMHPEWKHCFWNDKTIDAFLEGRPAKDMYNMFTTIVSKTEYFRLLILHAFGGVYIDCDVECVKPFDDDLLRYPAFVAREDGIKVCNAVVGAEPKSAFITAQLNAIPQMPVNRPGWSVPLITKTTNEMEGKGVIVCPTEFFYPFNWDERDKTKMIPTSRTYAIHHWAKTWFSKGY